MEVKLHVQELLALGPFRDATTIGSPGGEEVADIELAQGGQHLVLRGGRGRPIGAVVEAGCDPADGFTIQLAPQARLVDAMNAVMRELLAQGRALAGRSGSLLQTLTEADLGGQDLTSIVALLSNLVGNSVMLKDSNYQVVAWHGDLADLDEPRQHTVDAGSLPDSILAMLDRDGLLTRIRSERRPFHIERHDELGLVPRVVCPVWSGDAYFGYLSISEGRRRLDQSDLIAAEYGATVIAFHLARDRAVAESVRSQKALLMYELLFNPTKRSSAGRRQAAMLDLDLDQRFTMVTMEVHAPKGEKWDDDRWSRARTSMITTIDGQLSRMGVTSAVALAEEEHLLVIVPGETQEVSRLAADLLRELVAYHQVDVPAVGVSQTRTGSDGLKESYEEARLAADLGRAVGAGAAVNAYVSLGALRLLSEIPGPAIERHLTVTLGDDQKFREQFRVTYGALVEAGYNKAAAARSLYIHVNTLKYRLARISRRTGHDPDDHNGRFALECTLRLLDLQRIRNHSET
jgi:sugar diacid utilization regulator